MYNYIWYWVFFLSKYASGKEIISWCNSWSCSSRMQ